MVGADKFGNVFMVSTIALNISNKCLSRAIGVIAGEYPNLL